MSTAVQPQKEQALAAATAWWDSRPFPLMPQGSPYPCTSCGRPIERREGTSLIGAQMRCPECTANYFATMDAAEAARGETIHVPVAPPVPIPRPSAEEAVAGPAPTREAPVIPPPTWVGPAEEAPAAPPPAWAAPTGPLAPPPAPPPPAQAPPRSRWRRSRTWIVVAAIIAVVGLVTTTLLLWAPWEPKAPPAGPGNVHVVAAAPDSVTLGWSAPSGQKTPSKYEVVVGGTHEVVASVPGNQTTYQVTGLDPATSYAYQTVAYWGDKKSQYSAEITATTTTPPVADGRLTGDMPVQVTVTATTDGLNVGQAWGDSWTFTPGCAAGPCATTLDGGVTPGGFQTHNFSVNLDRNGAAYSGSTTAHITHCGPPGNQVDVNDTVTVNLTVTSGAVSDGTWLANAWNGTVEVQMPYTQVGNYYCDAQSITLSASSTQ